MISKKPILVTGSPRSGTTWVGRIIAQAPPVHYVHEPFNISGLPCYCGVNFDYWFYYISSENESDFCEHLTHLIHPKLSRVSLLNLIAEMKQTRRVRPLVNFTESLFKQRPLLKDPLALFSAEWLTNTFNMDVVILIRHPAAIVSSYKTLNWTHPFSHFLKQPLLMDNHLANFADEITDFANNEYDVVDQAALLWKLTHHIILKYSQTRPGWIFVRHADISLDPINGFQTVFDRLNLLFSDEVKQTVQSHTTSANPSEHADPYSIKRQSKQTIWFWKNKLTSEEIYRVRRRTEEISQAFFKEEDW